MTNITYLPQYQYQNSTALNFKSENSKFHINPSAIKQYLHNKHVDEFFWTDFEAPPKRQSPLAAAGSITGVLIPAVLFAKKQNPKLNFKSFKALRETISGAFNIRYELPQILGVGLGGVLGGLAGGLLDRKERNKIKKIEEASYQAMNVTFPALLVAGGIKLCEKTKALNKTPIKMLAPILGIFTGANLAVAASNHLDDKLFDKYLRDGERKFEKKDFIVHIDDVFGALALAKIPLAEKLPISKILPAIFAWSGYHVGDT